MVKKCKKIIVAGEKFNVCKTQRFKTSYGYAGQKGIIVYRAKDDYLMGKFKNLTEFKKDRKISLALAKKYNSN